MPTRVLILADFGYVKKSDQETCVLFELIAHRYETGSLIITSNQPCCEWDTIFPDEMMTVAAIDRLVHHANLIEVRSDSYRRKAAMRQMDTEQTATLPAATPPLSKASVAVVKQTPYRCNTVIVVNGMTVVATITPSKKLPHAIQARRNQPRNPPQLTGQDNFRGPDKVIDIR